MDIEDSVLQLVSENRGVQPAKLKPSDRLNVDLGMDGDDASEFFESLAAEFNVDCSDLQDRWDDYFGPEGVPSFSTFATVLICCIPALVISIFLHLPLWAWLLLGLGTLVTWAQFNAVRERKNPTFPQITIAQLVEAATTKRLIL